MTRHQKDKEKERIVRNPFEWVFHAALWMLGAAIALTLALELLAAIWHWVVAGALVIAVVYVAVRVAAARRRQW